MDLFTNTTVVRPLAEIQRERLLPMAGEVIARVGDAVSSVQVIARTKINPGYFVLDACAALDISRQDATPYLQCELGTAVRKGDLLLVRKERFGRKIEVQAPVSGIVEQVRNGFVMFARRPKVLDLRAVIPGEISNVIPRRGVLISTMGALVEGVWGSGREGFGTVHLAVNKPRAVAEDGAFSDARGCLVAVGQLKSDEQIKLAEEYGARGIIAGGISPTVFETARQYRIPVMVTDGVGNVGMTKPVFELLRQLDGHEAAVLANPQTGQRPELIIPRPNAVPDSEPLAEAVPLRKGQMVRLLQAPYRGRVGTVVTVYTRPRLTALGTYAVGANVALAKGRVVFVPKDNLDIII